MAEAFVYCWTDHRTEKLYVGVHKGKTDDGYICSSKLLLEEFAERPSDFTRQIIAEGAWDDMFCLEGKILEAANVRSNPSFYNQHNGSGDFRTKAISKKTRKILSKYHQNRWDNMTENKKREIAENVSAALKGKPKSEAHKNNLKGPRPHVNQAGSNNNNAVAISTPHGIFGSISEAAKALGMNASTVHYRVNSKRQSTWEYVL